MKTLVIIPAYNEENSIGQVIARIRLNLPQADILVINDGSIDNTALIASNLGVEVIDLPFNLGIGGAMQTGYLYASRNGYNLAIQVDGDGQHDPSYIGKLIEPVINSKVDMVIGSRYICKTDYKSTFSRRLGMLFFSALVNLLTGQKVKDTTSGFRVVNKTIIDYFAKRYPTDYPEVDVLIKLYRKNFRIIEMPVEMCQRQSGKSSITPIRSVYYLIKVSLSLIIGAISSEEGR